MTSISHLMEVSLILVVVWVSSLDNFMNSMALSSSKDRNNDDENETEA